MNRTLSEAKALKKLNIPDFRHLTKEKVSGLVALMPYMSPEAQIKAIEQFPDFARTISGALKDYENTIRGIVTSNDKNMEGYRAEALSIIEALEKLLERDDLSFENKKYVIDTMTKVHQMSHEKDSENKKFNWAIAATVTTVVASSVAVVASVLGGKAKIDPTGDV